MDINIGDSVLKKLTLSLVTASLVGACSTQSSAQSTAAVPVPAIAQAAEGNSLSDGGGEIRGRKSGDLYRSRGIEQELTTADSSQFNGVAEHALGSIETAAMSSRIQVLELFPGA